MELICKWHAEHMVYVYKHKQLFVLSTLIVFSLELLNKIFENFLKKYLFRELVVVETGDLYQESSSRDLSQKKTLRCNFKHI